MLKKDVKGKKKIKKKKHSEWEEDAGVLKI